MNSWEKRKVSIIIPVYNAEGYIKKCIKSVMNQTYKNLEIICVNDGSIDNSGMIIDKLAGKDKRIIVIHKTNGGESSARNVGLKICTGDYIGFMDCDDWIEPGMYEILVKAIEQNEVDMVASGWYKDIGNKSYEMKNDLPVETGVFDKKQLLKYIYMRDSYRGFAYIWNKLYRKNVLLDDKGHLLLLDEKLKLGGDVVFLAQIVTNTKRAIYIDKAFYHYVQRESSGSHSQNIDIRKDSLKAYEMIIDMFEKQNIDNLIVDYIKRFLVYHSSNVALICYEKGNREDLLMCQAIMRKYEKEYKLTNKAYPDRISRFEDICNYYLN